MESYQLLWIYGEILCNRRFFFNTSMCVCVFVSVFVLRGAEFIRVTNMFMNHIRFPIKTSITLNTFVEIRSEKLPKKMLVFSSVCC